MVEEGPVPRDLAPDLSGVGRPYRCYDGRREGSAEHNRGHYWSSADGDNGPPRQPDWQGASNEGKADPEQEARYSSNPIADWK